LSTPVPPPGDALRDPVHMVAPLPEDHAPKPLAQRIGAVLWPSFFSACIATMVFSAFVDPLALRDITFPELRITRELGYSVAFFMFWLATGFSSLFTWFLLRPPGRFSHALPTDKH